MGVVLSCTRPTEVPERWAREVAPKQALAGSDPPARVLEALRAYDGREVGAACVRL
jgi:hypothetical protein